MNIVLNFEYESVNMFLAHKSYCRCNAYLQKGTNHGNCNIRDGLCGHGKSWCYVDKNSLCDDQKKSEDRLEAPYSWSCQACVNREEELKLEQSQTSGEDHVFFHTTCVANVLAIVQKVCILHFRGRGRRDQGCALW